jgi:hypothetical protein
VTNQPTTQGLEKKFDSVVMWSWLGARDAKSTLVEAEQEKQARIRAVEVATRLSFQLQC